MQDQICNENRDGIKQFIINQLIINLHGASI